MSKEDRKIAKFQVGFGYWIVFCLIYGLTRLNYILISKLVIFMHLISDVKISLNGIMLVAVLLMLIFLILFQVRPFIYKDGLLDKNPFAFKITDRQ